jgi:two-component system, NarL family, sensor histidine kinase DesK
MTLAGLTVNDAEHSNRAQEGTAPGPQLDLEPFLWLFNLLLLFVPMTWQQPPEGSGIWVYPTLLSLVLFLALYWRACRRRWRLTVLDVLPFALLAYLCVPFNPIALVYLAYAALFAPYALPGLARPLLLTLGLIALHALEIVLIHQPSILITIFWTVLIVIPYVLNSYSRMEITRKNAELKASHAENRRLAAVAERARIGRDLHDVLGQTLSLIAIKSELARKLTARDLDAGLREMEDVMLTARESLRQMRAAVTGMQSASIEEELRAARTLLEPSGVALTAHRDPGPLPAAAETALALAIREAATNIQRHAQARHVWIEIRLELPSPPGSAGIGQAAPPAASGTVLLIVRDNGQGGATVRGSGITGIQSRAASLGGVLHMDSPAGQGTTLRVELPLDAEGGLPSSAASGEGMPA